MLDQNRCEGIHTPEEMKRLCEEMQTEIVEHMLENYRREILEGKTPSKDATIYIIGGQNASGKSMLISQLGQKNRNTISIIIDDMKAHHPFREYIDSNFPNESEELLHLACFEVFDRLLTSLLDDKFDVTIERTLGSESKTRQFVVEPANHGYNIEIHVTATHEMNSLLSAVERFVYECKLRDDFVAKKSVLKIEPRPIALKHHDDTYKNICTVIRKVENGCFADNNGEKIFPKVFIWDRTPGSPTNIYETGCKTYPSAEQAMYAGRTMDLNRCQSKNECGIAKRKENIVEELKTADPSSTLAKYTEYCNAFIDELEKREGKLNRNHNEIDGK